MEQDDSMERSIDVNEGNTYVSHYPDIRRYSMANVLETSKRPQQYSANTTQEMDDNQDETRINMPSSHPPQYSQAVADKLLADKKVKVSAPLLFCNLVTYIYLPFASSPETKDLIILFVGFATGRKQANLLKISFYLSS